MQTREKQADNTPRAEHDQRSVTIMKAVCNWMADKTLLYIVLFYSLSTGVGYFCLFSNRDNKKSDKQHNMVFVNM